MEVIEIKTETRVVMDGEFNEVFLYKKKTILLLESADDCKESQKIPGKIILHHFV